ncbi:hypothetical protein HY407_01020 [Candidatus Gottesmanbacteria bacterium]|nr:hypothetical protein [Candidatus Gottesmanbacteria bacterium]
MPNPETSPQRHIPITEYLKSPAQLLVYTTIAYAGIMFGKQAVPVLNNLVEVLTKVVGGAQ